MKKTNNVGNVQDLWDSAIERATEDISHAPELRPENLTHTAGLHLKSGVQAGVWGISGECSSGCTDPC